MATSEPRKRAAVLAHLGPYVRHPPVAVFGEVLDECFAEYRAALGDVKTSERPHQFLITRPIYISETTSVSARLAASWGLSLPAMSLTRDRYEQTVRFSWLARQPDHKELVKYIHNYYSKVNKVFRNLNSTQRVEFEKISDSMENWMTFVPTKKQRKYLERWEALSLDTMAAKRDALAPLADSPLDRETLADLYTPIYRQFSSITHFDAYGVSMLGLHAAPPGEVVLAPDPWWPAVLSMYDALFSLVQCHEALLAFYDTERTERFTSLHERWREACQKIEFRPVNKG